MNIPINPKLRDDFDNTPNEERPADEIEKWWGVPYIVTTSWEQHQADATYDDFLARMASYGSNFGWTPPTREEWQAQHEQNRANWLDWFPNDGIRYEVRCLDGGAWDRSTSWGMFATLDEAIECGRRFTGNS